MIPIVAGLLLLLVLTNLFRTAFSDPGVIPRATAAEAADIERVIATSGTFFPNIVILTNFS